MKKVTSAALIALFVLLVAVSNSSAQPFSARCKLEATDNGYEFAANGLADLTRKIVERFAIRVSAKVKNGTVLIVSATTKSGETFDVGAIPMVLYSGSLEMNSFRNDLSQLFPIDNIKKISVRMQEKTLLEGICLSGTSR